MRSEPTFVVNPDGDISYVNKAALSLFGASPDRSIVGTSILEYISSSYHAPLIDQFKRIDSGDASAMGLTLKSSLESDDSREFIALSTPVEWDGSEQIQLLLFETDEQLPSGLSARTMDASPIGITIDDATLNDEQVVYVNDGFCELTGYEREEILGRNCRVLQGDETDEGIIADIRRAIDAEEPITTEIRNYRKDGSMFWNRLTITPIEDETGTVTHFLGFQEDVSERKLYEREKTLFEMQADASEQSVFITDAAGTIEYVNSAFERTTGYSAHEAIGQNPRLLKSRHQDEEFYRELWETITAGEVWEAELTNRRKSGELYQTTQKIIPVTAPDGAITNFIAIEEDITDAQFIEQVLHVMDRVMRHNVRNSVTAISGYADLLEDKLDEEEHKAAIQTIRDHAEKLGKLSEETRAIRELFQRRHAEHSLSVDTIEGFVAKRQEMHPDAVLDLSIDVEDGTVIQNGSLLQLAIDEALENAIVHNDRDDPRVEIQVTQTTDGTELSVEIADNGPGMPDDQWDVIMAGEETPLSHTTGIGLWLIYWTLTALGGTMDCAENEPRGTILTFRVPLAVGGRIEDWNSDT
ncbi:PAS domain-containing protein [Halobellus ordinarius]|uniref:PAS domain-containing protein n=1 Tax=Halobellus ordinarius TaxID=3075120 RepID=UPI002880B4C6|nr:PAS domain-containing protein [Halobellus sp. ZY16]